ncbi:MAG: diphosphomevalonate decarboxylase [Gammaproteobacteria bacterium]
MSYTKFDVVNTLLQEQNKQPAIAQATAFAPVNIALCKYWGKRDNSLNLPCTASLSIALPYLGTHTSLCLIDSHQDTICLNNQPVASDSEFAKKLVGFLDLFRSANTWRVAVDTHSDIPVAAGLASSASGFAALVLALQQLFAWTLTQQQLSILARLGSGSACRSLWPGFVLWQAGTRTDGMDSHGIPLSSTWPELRMGLLIFHDQAKAISSRTAMQRTIETSILYQSWLTQVEHDLHEIQTAIAEQNFSKLGIAAERNALAMHATMLSSWPPIMYSSIETIKAMQAIWQLRAEGVPVYFTQDAGPHLKLLFQAKDTTKIQQAFTQITITAPFLT